MTIAEIVEIESNRQSSDQYGVIHLLKENNFYRAHDWSAWLMTKFPMGEAKNKPLNISAKRLKDNYIEAWVGFPVASLGKYIPNDGTVKFNPVDDNHIEIIIPLPEEYLNVEAETFRKGVDDWKESLPMNEQKKTKREDREVSEAAPRITRMSDVLARIVSYPIESKSPMEAWEFLRQLRQQVSAMF